MPEIDEEPTTTEDERDETAPGTGSDGPGEPALDPREAWRQLLERDGQEPEPEAETPPAEGTPAAQPAAPDDPRLAELEALGASMAAPEPPPSPVAPSQAPPAPAPIVTPAAAPAPPAIPEFITMANGEKRKTADVLYERWGEEAEVVAATLQAMVAAMVPPAPAPAPPAIEEHPAFRSAQERLAQVQAELEHQRAVREIAAFNPEVYAIDARRPGGKNPHPFWGFLAQQSEAVQRAAVYGTPEQTAKLIGVWQDRERAAAQAAETQTAREAAKARKDALYRETPAARSAPATSTRPLSQEEWNRLPAEERRRLYRQEAARMAGAK